MGGYLAWDYQRGEALRFVAGMGNGWNLGNSLDAHTKGKGAKDLAAYESYWGNPPTNKAMVTAIKKAGFNTIRIPVTWYEHLDKDGIIDANWLDRVQEVVDYAIKQEMYVIINLHHENWYQPTLDNAQMAKKRLRVVWRQIALRFASYDQHLLFEGMNEPRLLDHELEWKGGDEAARQLINEYNEVFVETVRASGENNAVRYLMLPTYAASVSAVTVDAFKLPKDDRLIVSVHAYLPHSFASNRDGTDKWRSDNEKDTQSIDEAVMRLDKRFIRKKIPVIIGEFGAVDKNNTPTRVDWAQYYVVSANKKGIPCILWDNGGKIDDSLEYLLFDRYNLRWIFPEIASVVAQSKVRT